MKKLSLILSAFLLISFFSCKDACEGIECNGGSCIDGTCLCPEGFYGDSCEVQCVNGLYQNGTCTCLAGYEGDACDIESRTRYYGTWSGTLTGCSVDTPIGEYPIPDFPISMEITESSEDIQTVDIMFGMESGTAEIDGNEFTLNPITQEVDAGGQMINLIFSGVGTLSSETEMDMDLDINVLGSVSTCPLVLTKG